MPLTFEPITLEKQAAYSARLALCPQVASDYSFVNLWGWAEEYGLSWAWTDSLVWIKQDIPQTALWAPVGCWKDIIWQEEMNLLGLGELRFIRVPEALMNAWKDVFGEMISSEKNRSQWDYLYDLRELIDLRGKRYHKKKNLLNQFKKKYDFDYLSLGLEMIERILGMQSEWCEWRDCQLIDSLASENRAIEKVLKTWDQLDALAGGALCVDETIVAYTLAEQVGDNMLLIHFEKGSPGVQGAYQAINQMFLSRFDERNESAVSVVNRMQDMGDEGLRKAKKSYHPIDFIRKYTVAMSFR